MDQERQIIEELGAAGVQVLEREVARIDLHGETAGIVGLKGFGGGFVGACASDFGEPEMKLFIRHTKAQSEFINNSLRSLDADYKIVLLHYSPIAETLHGERREIYPFLGSYLLAEGIDEGGCHIVFHGHAHRGVERGETPAGIPVRNVAQHVIRHVFNIYSLNGEGLLMHGGDFENILHFEAPRVERESGERPSEPLSGPDPGRYPL
jgi:Icc-related predicted phosphoesterase